MYHLRSYDLKQDNIAMELSEKPSIDISIHRLNPPLFIKCKDNSQLF